MSLKLFDPFRVGTVISSLPSLALVSLPAPGHDCLSPLGTKSQFNKSSTSQTSALLPDINKIKGRRPRLTLVGRILPELSNVAISQLTKGHFCQGLFPADDRV